MGSRLHFCFFFNSTAVTAVFCQNHIQRMFTSLGGTLSLHGLLDRGSLHTPLWTDVVHPKNEILEACLWLWLPTRGVLETQGSLSDVFLMKSCFLTSWALSKSHSAEVVKLSLSWIVARTNSLHISLFRPSCVQCKTCRHWVMTMSNQYYSTITSVVVLAVTNERNPHFSKTQGFSTAVLKQQKKPHGERN